MLPALRAYADGFVSSLIGGLLYCAVLVYFQPEALGSAWWRVGTLSLVCGGVEMWRVSRRRTLRGRGAWVLWALTAGLFTLWALGATVAASHREGDERRRADATHFRV